MTVDEIRTVDHDIPAGMETDLGEHGCDRDEFPAIYRELVTPADIILICGPIWLGDQSSQTRKIIERLYAYSSEVNQAGQWAYYGKVGGALTTGNDDGGKQVSAQVLYALQHIGLRSLPNQTRIGRGKPVRAPPTSIPPPAGSATHGPRATRCS